MLSVLIPVYNYDASILIHQLYEQLKHQEITFEIRVYDDHSTKYQNQKKSYPEDSRINYQYLDKNIGRSAIRNLLGRTASYDRLVFIDAGTLIDAEDFIQNYLKFSESKVVVGGLKALPQPPEIKNNLRWLYTKEREVYNKDHPFKNLTSANFLIQKEILLQHPFDENLKTYGCEDVLFFYELIKNKIPIERIENPVVHQAEDSMSVFIKKTENALENLFYLIEAGKLPKDIFSISKWSYRFKMLGTLTIINNIFKFYKKTLLRKMMNTKNSLFYFDLYRLGYFCYLQHKK